jgi:hypothetical protein
MLTSQASATLTVSVSQFGADSGSVMQGVPFTVTVSGLTGTGSVTLTTLQNSTTFSSSENSTKTYSEGTTSVSWTTVTANQKLSAQTISAVSAVPYSDSGTSDAFDIKLPPSIVTSVTPASFLDPSGYQSIQATIQNWGETTAKNVAVNLTLPSGINLATGSQTQTVSEIEGGEGGSGESVGLSWTLQFASPSDSTITISTAPSNADSITDSITVSVTESPSGPESPGGGTPAAIAGTKAPTEKNESRRPELVPGVGLRNNVKLQTALQTVLAKGKLSQEAFENMIRLSNSITSQVTLNRDIKVYNGSTTLSTRFMNTGQNRIRNFIVYEKVPKTFESNAASIRVTALGASGYQTVEADPEYIFVYSEMNSGQQITITYSLEGEVNTSVIDEFQTELYAESLDTGPGEPAGPSEVRICNPGERRCSGMNLQQCSAAGDNWITIQTCTDGCEDNACIGEPYIYDYGWLILILIAVVAAGAILVYKKRKKEKPFKV